MFVISAPLWQFQGPMVDINDALIRKVAELSRLKIEEGEIGSYTNSIREILRHVDQLQKLNTGGVEPMFYGIDDSLRMRSDTVSEFPVDQEGQPKVLRSAPLVEDGGFKVPQIVG
jgi:aspartyl-tRNA(Asn)/glutamyl-tRNA(Gln) amidotransferase subunit C